MEKEQNELINAILLNNLSEEFVFGVKFPKGR